ncbi:MAG TPA: serine/threonine-protein kinase [Polyangiaceae bacterium]|nr:serine/threonine-protein kinase [Polyangiaceae bacterium]
MGITVVCQACGNRRTVPASLYDEKIKGRVVKIPCRSCGATISVDGTVPPPPAAENASTPTTEDPLKVVIPVMAKLPSEHVSGGSEATEPQRTEMETEPNPEPGQSTSHEGDHASAPREKQISHVDGPISERGPSHTVGRYALFEQFAAGGMATVHFGRLDGAGGFARVVAVKRLLPHLLENHEFTEMLLKEARLAARVRHPNVVATLDVVATKGDVLLVLDYVHGEALSTLCRTQAKEKKEQIALPIVVGIVSDMLQGLSAIHDATDEKGRSLSLVHRDVSPPNVLVGADGVARVLDFGIATALDHIEETAPERRKGKRGYMSPEQVRGERLTQRSDIFAAGIVIWELLAMRRLFPVDQEAEVGDAVLRGDYPRVSQYRPDIPKELDEIVMRALALEPEARFATMHELADAFEAAAPARANARRIGEWVLDLARDALGERTRKLARVENWVADEIPLKSTPFAAELPLRPPSPSTQPPQLFRAEMPLDIPPAPPLPQSVAEALERTSSRPPSPSAAPLLKAKEPAAPQRSGSRWWLWALLLVGVAVYLALRAKS